MSVVHHSRDPGHFVPGPLGVLVTRHNLGQAWVERLGGEDGLRNRYHSFTFKEYGNGAQLDNGFLVLAKIGRSKVRWSRPMEGVPRTMMISREADGWYVCVSCAEVPTQPLPAADQHIPEEEHSLRLLPVGIRSREEEGLTGSAQR